MQRFKIVTLGCKTNIYDAENLRNVFLANGLVEAEPREEADLQVLISCCVTHKAERRTRKELNRMLRQSEHTKSRVVLTGCYASLQRNNRAEVKFIKEPSQIPEYLQMKNDINKYFLSHSRFFLKVQEGCNFVCSYCIIPKVRGHSRSRSLGEISKDIYKAQESGTREIVLTGTQLGDWGKEWGLSLVQLIDYVLKIPGRFRVRLSSIDPIDISDKLVEVLQSERVCKHIHLPLQSASPKILKLMRRHYTISFYSKKLNLLRKKIRNFSLGTDVIVGFSGETEKDFNETYRYIEENDFSYLHIFPYSPRPTTGGSHAYNYKSISENEKKKRVNKLFRLDSRLRKNFRKKHIGKILRVVPEKAKNGKMTGTSSEYIKVFFQSSPDNGIVPVLAEELYRDGLKGEVWYGNS